MVMPTVPQTAPSDHPNPLLTDLLAELIEARSYPLYYFASASIAFANVESGLLLQ